MTARYFDTAYIGKCYLNEPDSDAVRALARSSDSVSSSSLCMAELACAIHRKVREGTLQSKQATVIRDDFLEDIGAGSWFMIPLSDRIMRQVELLTRTLPKTTALRACDAIHIVSAIQAGFQEVWTNDRHLLAAAPYFGIKGRQVSI